MDKKQCEFCDVLSPIVYCQSDAAHLCLSCDARVHWANELSYRHTHTPVCGPCGYGPAEVRCLDHEMFMCLGCDESSHPDDATCQHRRSAVSCYVGCPSATELSALWGLDSDQLGINSSIEFEVGFCSRGTKVVKYDIRQHNNHLILQQIHDLERLQHSMGVVDNSRLTHAKEPIGRLPFKHDTMWKSHTSLNDHFGEDLLRSPFSQQDNNFTISSAVISNPLQGDSFWEYINNEVWLENMEDLVLCDEVRCFEAINMPDVDLTFRNFEELFGNEQEVSRVDVEYTQCSFSDKQSLFGNLDRRCASSLEDTRGHSPPVCLKDAGKEIHPPDQIQDLQSTN